MDFIPPMLESFQNPIWANWAYIHLYTVPTASPSEGYLAHLGFYTTCVGIFSKPCLGQLGLYTFYTTCVKIFFKTLFGPIGPIYIFIQSQHPILLKAIWPILDFIPPVLEIVDKPIWANWACVHVYTVATTSPSQSHLAHLGFYPILLEIFFKSYFGLSGHLRVM